MRHEPITKRAMTPYEENNMNARKYKYITQFWSSDGRPCHFACYFDRFSLRYIFILPTGKIVLSINAS